MSGRTLAKAIGKSEKYVRVRLADETDFTINDVDAICELFRLDPIAFLMRIEAKTEELTSIDEPELRSRYRLAANTDDSSERLDPDLQ